MELADYLAIMRKRWVSIVLITLLAVGGAVVATLLTTPLYEARSQVYVSVRTGDTTADLLSGSSFSQKQVTSYTDLVGSPRVLIPVIEQLDLATTPDELATQVSASSPLNTVLINITATDADPQLASDIANATATSLSDVVVELETPDVGPSPVQISTVRSASAPTTPSSPNTKLNLALGLLVGLAAGFGLAVLREVLDTRVRTEADVHEVTDTAVIAQMTFDEAAAKTPLIVHANPHSQRSEAFRRLRTNLQFLDVDDRLRSIVVTSALPGEGKTTTAVNLAITLADAGQKVILVDADLRRPSVAEVMGLEGSAGLTTALIGRAALNDVIQPWGDRHLHVLPSGQIPPNPSELLGSPAMSSLLTYLSTQYDVVLIDTPPLLPVTDAAILSRSVSGALVVAGANTLHRQQLADALGGLDAVGARILGILLNRVPAKQSSSYQYYDYTPHAATATTPRQDRKDAKRSAKEPATATTTGQVPVAHAAHPGEQRPVRTTTRRMPHQVPVSAETLESLLAGGDEPAPRRNTWPGGPLSREG